MRNISIVLVLLFTLFTVSCKCKDGKKKIANKDTVKTVTEEKFALKDSTEIKTKEDVVFVDDKDGNLKPMDGDKTGKYYIIVGSFKQTKNADKLSSRFASLGYATQILPKTNEYTRVAISAFATQEDARKELKLLRSEYNDASFWLLLK